MLGFTGEEVDGVMGVVTFNALKRFAYHHDLVDVVLRGEFEDIEFWGFEQYLIKYHKYWIREIKNQRIFKDVHDKEVAFIKHINEIIKSNVEESELRRQKKRSKKVFHKLSKEFIKLSSKKNQFKKLSLNQTALTELTLEFVEYEKSYKDRWELLSKEYDFQLYNFKTNQYIVTK